MQKQTPEVWECNLNIFEHEVTFQETLIKVEFLESIICLMYELGLMPLPTF